MNGRATIRILFAGAYGIESAGDDLPLVVLMELLQRRRPEVEFDFRVLSRHPDNGDDERYGVTTIQNLEYGSRDEAVGRWFKGLNFGDDTETLDEVKREIRGCDALVLGAGNWMIDLCIGVLRGPVPLLALYVFLAELYRRPVFLYGMSAGPLGTEWGRDLCRWVTERADVVTVRDRSSQELLSSLMRYPRELTLLPDSTLAAGSPVPERAVELLAGEGIVKSPGSRWLAFGLRDLAVSLEGEALERAWVELASFCNELAPRYELLFVPQCTYRDGDDRLTAQRFADRLDSAVRCHFVEDRYHPTDLIGFYGCCDAAITVRLHAAVFAALARTPVVALEYLPKVRGFMESVGLEDQVIDIEKIEEVALSSALERAIHLVDDESERLDERIDVAAKEAEGYADLLLELLGLDEDGDS